MLVKAIFLNKVVKVGLTERHLRQGLKQVRELAMQAPEESVPERRNSQGKGPKHSSD